jgi:hypothetical protein
MTTGFAIVVKSSSDRLATELRPMIDFLYMPHTPRWQCAVALACARPCTSYPDCRLSPLQPYFDMFTATMHDSGARRAMHMLNNCEAHGAATNLPPLHTSPLSPVPTFLHTACCWAISIGAHSCSTTGHVRRAHQPCLVFDSASAGAIPVACTQQNPALPLSPCTARRTLTSA